MNRRMLLAALAFAGVSIAAAAPDLSQVHGAIAIESGRQVGSLTTVTHQSVI